ncbi:MAG: hypothetical protein GTO62_17770, partial [Planctomycetales bacterium]|nr:hypothetical protein [Planctomycetales bacterium]
MPADPAPPQVAPDHQRVAGPRESTAMSPEKDLLAQAQQPAQAALRLHPFYRGKVQIALKCPVRDFDDF